MADAGNNNGTKKGGKRERKPRVEQEVDDSPAEVDAKGNLVKVDRPDEDAHQKTILGLTSRIEKLITKRNDLTTKQNDARGNNKPFMDKRKGLIEKVKVERAERKKHLDKAADIKKHVDKVIAASEARRAKEKKAKDELKFESVDQVEAKIAQLERKHETQALEKAEEKAIMKELSQLRGVRRKLAEFKAEQAAASSSKGGEDVPTLRAQIRQCYDHANVHRDAAEVISKELDALTEQNKAFSGMNDKLQKERKTIQDDIDNLFKERDTVREAYNKHWTKYKKFVSARNKQYDAERKEREEAYKKEREEYERQLEEEEMKKKPWEAEIALCDQLSSYLQNLVGKKSTSVAASAAGSAAPATDASKPEARAGGDADAFSGMKAVGKKKDDLEDFMVMGAGKKKTKKKAAKTDKKIVHPIELLQSFALLQLTVPGKIDEVPAAVKKVAEKRAYYDVLPRAPKKKAGDAQPAAATEGSEKKAKKPSKVNVPSVDSSDLFPTLPGSKSPKSVPVSPPAGPSAVDRVKSSPVSP